ncbi:MAG: nicotinate-nucleotide adenylyltransferase [Bacteroidales bacterium]|nr:nicotinate-nucleotide adenylyltransferase [Bacteroidales bacterium]
MKNIGLFFGSFNPVHHGHLMLANFMLEFVPFDEVWFVISPQNPLKDAGDLWPENLRLEWVKKAIGSFGRFKACNIEFELPRPSYTIETLRALKNRFPQHEFSVIMGADSLSNFHQWKEHEAILKNFSLVVYPRKGFSNSLLEAHPSVKRVDAPQIEISSTFIRQGLRKGKDLHFFLPDGLFQTIKEAMNFH